MKDLMKQPVTKALALAMLRELHKDTPRGCERVIKEEDIDKVFGNKRTLICEEYLAKLADIIRAKHNA